MRSKALQILEELQKDGYTGSQTTIKNCILDHRDLIPVRIDSKPVARARRYETFPGYAMQMEDLTSLWNIFKDDEKAGGIIIGIHLTRKHTEDTKSGNMNRNNGWL